MTDSRTSTLALGAPGSAFYRSLRHVLFAFGDMTFRAEKEFEPPELVVEAFERGGFDQVLLPNPYGNAHRLACYRALRARGVRVVASDRGALPDSWFFDHGFNQDSPSYQPDAWDHPLTDEQREHVRRYIRELSGSNASLEAQGRRQDRAALLRRLGLEGKKVLFVPLQRPGDTVVRYFSGSVSGLEEMLERISEAERLLRERAGDEWRIILKKHPLETDYMITSNDRLKYATDDLHIHDVLEISDAVMVLNSGVGLLSLLFGNPTYHVGEAFYGHPGLAERVSTPQEMVERLLDPKPPDREKVERFTHHLLTNVYSFARSQTEVVKQRDGSLARVTRYMDFRELRVLGEQISVPDAHVLVITPVVPWPIYRGSQSRIDTMIRAMMDDNKMVSMCVLNMSFDRPSKDIVRELRARYPAVDRIEVRKHTRYDKGVKRVLNGLMRAADVASGGTHRVSNLDTCPPNFRRAVAEVCEELEPEFLLVNYAKMTPAVPRAYRGVRVIDTHDYQTQFLREDQQQNRVRRHISTTLFERSEIAALRRYDRIIAISPLEADTFRSLCPEARVHCVPAFSEPQPSRDIFLNTRSDALFVGSLSNFNVKGLLWFLNEVLPLVRRELPDFRLSVVGNIARSKEIDQSRYPEAEFLGIVDDLRSCYEQCRLVIAPILGGAGMKIKVVEALGMRKAVILTPKAAEGIALTHREHAWLAKEPASFAEGIVRLTRDAELRERIAVGGFAFHAEHHSPAAVAKALHDVFA